MKKIIQIIVLIVVMLFATSFYFSATTKIIAERNEPSWGVSFTKSFSEHLGQDWRELYLAILDDLKFRRIRIGINWDEIEPEPGSFNFSDYDWMLDEAEKRHAMITFVIGRRLIRWPECRAPIWASNLEEPQIQERLLRMLEEVVSHFKDNKAVSVWQVENEPLFTLFGECPKSDKKFVEREITLVRQLDGSRSIAATESGEISLWWRVSSLDIDTLGVTMYRRVWHPLLGFLKYPFPPWIYNMKARLVSWRVPRVIISELQTEPWAPNGFYALSSKEEARTMSHEIFNETIEFARSSGFDEIYFWGVEWWRLKKQNGDSFYWNKIRELNSSAITPR